MEVLVAKKVNQFKRQLTKTSNKKKKKVKSIRSERKTNQEESIKIRDHYK